MPQHWSLSFPGSVPAERISEFLNDSIDLIQGDRLGEASHELWGYADRIKKIDLEEVPSDVLDATARAVDTARSLLQEQPPKATECRRHSAHTPLHTGPVRCLRGGLQPSGVEAGSTDSVQLRLG